MKLKFFLFLILILSVFAAFTIGAKYQGNQNPAAQPVVEAAAPSSTIRCGYVLYPPYLEKDLASGQLKGVAYDLIGSIGQTFNKKIEWVREIPVGADIPELKKGGIDAVCAITGAYDTNMFDQLAYSDYIFIVKNKVYARADDARFNGPLHLSDLDKPDLRFAGIEGDTSLIFPHMLMPHVQIVSHPALSEPAQLFQDVKLNKADLVMVEGAPGMRAMQNNPGAFKILEVQDSLPTYAMQIAVLKSNLALKDSFNEIIRFMKLNGQFEPILKKYDPAGDVFVRAN